MKSVLVALVVSAAPAAVASTSECIAPGTCTPPSLKYSRVMRGPQPSQQWNINGGFCGAFSVQQSALAHGAWISQDLVRKANGDQDWIAHNMHGDPTLGYEVVPTNVAYTAQQLKLAYDEWDWNATAPQVNITPTHVSPLEAAAYKTWIKGHLTEGSPVVMFPLCKGDSHVCYPGSCPNGGAMDHIEPIYGIFSSHPLDDPVAYPDDVILHLSDQDQMPYYRAMSTMEDSLAMDGNCLNAQPGFGVNEMYPCFDQNVTYGLAVRGLAVKPEGNQPSLLRVSVVVNTTYEPDVRRGESPVPLQGSVEVDLSNWPTGGSFTLYRYDGTPNVPDGPPFDTTATKSVPFEVSDGESAWAFEDPDTFLSDTAVYYIAVYTPV